ncbi:TIM-barrel domain-containing protein [Alicyclobacillus sp. SO9]|uniref:glycoside hydrolase family 31 protein n=1 Tax=Alicyclobacillus sp. SO9 TaxID=2665646 RepID=UPI0018E7E2D5|nr:TIM-barrel domain-containing protein [Alicyclobacillus sp. SO9]QQE78639.1 glycoside hydrolase family 31 protein [Alicyclobacillus sp. SO9]
METSESIRPDKAVETGTQTMEGSTATLGRVLGYQADKQGVLLYCEHGNIAVSSPVKELVRFTLFTGTHPELSTSVAVIEEFESRHFEVDEDADLNRLTVKWADVTAVVHLQDSTCEVVTHTGQRAVEGLQFYQTTEGNAGLSAAAHPQTHYYGLGEKTSFLDKRGESYTMWNSDVYAPHVPEIEALYVSIPFLIPFDQNQAYGLFLDNTGHSTFDMRQFEDAFEVRTKTGGVDVYVITGPLLKDVIRRYTALTGRMPVPPKWALGYHQSRYSYMSQDEVLELARTFRTKRIPLSAVYLDIHYMRDYRVFTFNGQRFPNPKAMMDELMEMGVRVVPIVDPGVKQDARYSIYRSGVEGNHFCRTLEGDIYIDDVWPGASAFPDFTDDRTAQWWSENQQFYTDLGVRGIWNDMNEPAVFNESKTMPGHIMHHNNGNPKTHEELHNVYGTLMSRATYKGLKDGLGGERPFVLTRSGYAGIQRYAAVWTGDNRSFWEHMAMAMPMVLNLGLSGVTFSGPDVGGFAHHASGELLARWTQMGAFFPFFRNHSALDTVRQEPWSFGEEIEGIVRRYIQLRYQFMPYLYSLFKEASETGVPVMRPLVLEYPDDVNTYNLSDEFLVGKDVLVAPVYRPDTRHRSVYLPKGIWVNYWTGKRYEGGQHVLAEAPLDTMPLYIRSGAVIPMDDANGTFDGALPAAFAEPSGLDQNTLLHVYLDNKSESALQAESDARMDDTVQDDVNRTTVFELYEDDGTTFAYQDGVYNQTAITVQDSAQEAVIKIEVQHQALSGNNGYPIVVTGCAATATVTWVANDKQGAVEQRVLERLSLEQLRQGTQGTAYNEDDKTLIIKLPAGHQHITVVVQKN